jgi:hypothetical protein
MNMNEKKMLMKLVCSIFTTRFGTANGHPPIASPLSKYLKFRARKKLNKIMEFDLVFKKALFRQRGRPFVAETTFPVIFNGRKCESFFMIEEFLL